jgi:hypothetical protein
MQVACDLCDIVWCILLYYPYVLTLGSSTRSAQVRARRSFDTRSHTCTILPVGAISARMDYELDIALNMIRFSQVQCSFRFREHRGCLFALVDDLRSGAVDRSSLSLRVYVHNGFYWTLDHRRLVALKLYEYIASPDEHMLLRVTVRIPPFRRSETDKMAQPFAGMNGSMIAVTTRRRESYLFDSCSRSILHWWADWYFKSR